MHLIKELKLLLQRLRYIFFLCLFIPNIVFSDFKTNINEPSEYSSKSLLSFTRNLVSKSEYYRAYVELNRLNSYYPDFLSINEILTSKHYILFKADKFSDVINFECKDSEFKKIDLLFKFDSYISKSNFKDAEKLISSWDYGGNSFFDAIFIKRKLFLNYLNNNIDGAFTFYSKSLNYFNKDVHSVKDIIDYTINENKKFKSPLTGAMLGIVPGLGYAYADNTNTGIVALIVVLFNYSLSYFAFNSNNDSIGFFTASIGTFFYGGSILGGYMESVRYNNNIRRNINNNLMEELKFKQDRDQIYTKYGIGK
jgi:hypothetical protein